MEITVGLFLVLVALAFACEFVDSSLGMGYGTILAPILLVLGFEPLVAVPAVLLSQAFGGFTASVFHHQFENASFKRDSRDLKIVAVVTGCGIIATTLAALLSLHLPRVLLKTYIGVLVMGMGWVVLINRPFVFSWKKMVGVGLLSAFNKGLSGGGFGPVVTAGQIMGGQDHKAAIGTTTLAEVPICTCGFLTYLIGRAITESPHPIMNVPFADFVHHMFAPEMFQWELLLALVLGSVLVSPFGAFTTRQMKQEKLHWILGFLIMGLGLWTLLRTWL